MIKNEVKVIKESEIEKWSFSILIIQKALKI